MAIDLMNKATSNTCHFQLHLDMIAYLDVSFWIRVSFISTIKFRSLLHELFG